MERVPAAPPKKEEVPAELFSDEALAVEKDHGGVRRAVAEAKRKEDDRRMDANETKKAAAEKLALVNGRVVTMDEDFPEAEAILFERGRVRAVGGSSEIRLLAGAGAEVVDLRKRTVLPGFCDTHMHLLAYGFSREQVDLNGCRSVEELVRRGQDHLRVNPVPPGAWLFGRGWNQDLFAERSLPSKEDLDRISTAHPILFSRTCGHVAAANSAALREAHITADLSVPGGVVEKNEAGEPSGILQEAVVFEWMERFIPDPSLEEIVRILEKTAAEALSQGLTTVHSDDFGAGRGARVLEAYRLLADSGRLGLRIREECLLPRREALAGFLERGLRTGDGDDWFRVGPVKILADGSLGGRTAALRAPYVDDPSTSGVPILSREELTELISLAHGAGMQVATHAIGDRTIELCLDVFEEVLTSLPREARHRIVHVQCGHPDLFRRMARLGVLGDVQPVFTASDWPMAAPRLGPERARWYNAWKTMRECGVHLSGGSDAPVEPFNPLWGLAAAVTRKDRNGDPSGGFQPQERLSLMEALELVTTGGAFTSFEEHIKGKLLPGMFGDAVVLNEDPFTVPPEMIKDLAVDLTVSGGVVRYCRN